MSQFSFKNLKYFIKKIIFLLIKSKIALIVNLDSNWNLVNFNVKINKYKDSTLCKYLILKIEIKRYFSTLSITFNKCNKHNIFKNTIWMVLFIIF